VVRRQNNANVHGHAEEELNQQQYQSGAADGEPTVHSAVSS
jgi:hypothetical protein